MRYIGHTNTTIQMYQIQQIMDFTNYPDWHVTNGHLPDGRSQGGKDTIKLGSDSYFPNK